MENKMTSIEWLHIEFQNRFPKETSEMYNNNQFSYEDMILKAKEMHKQEIIDSYEDVSTKDGEFLTGEQYYNETYEK
jgi:hypothetical protein